MRAKSLISGSVKRFRFTDFCFSFTQETGHFGSDCFGRAIFSRAIYGTLMKVSIGLDSVIFAFVAGGAIGMRSAYLNGRGHFLMRSVGAQMAFLALLMALVLITLLDRNVFNSILVIGIASPCHELTGL